DTKSKTTSCTPASSWPCSTTTAPQGPRGLPPCPRPNPTCLPCSRRSRPRCWRTTPVRCCGSNCYGARPREAVSSSVPPPPSPPGAGVPGQAAWVPALQQEAARLCRVCTAAAALPEFQPAAIASRYQALLAQFQAPTFLASGDFLLDMGGHEMMTGVA